MYEDGFIHEEYLVILEIIKEEEQRRKSRMSDDEINEFVLTYLEDHAEEIARKAWEHLK